MTGSLIWSLLRPFYSLLLMVEVFGSNCEDDSQCPEFSTELTDFDKHSKGGDKSPMANKPWPTDEMYECMHTGICGEWCTGYRGPVPPERRKIPASYETLRSSSYLIFEACILAPEEIYLTGPSICWARCWLYFLHFFLVVYHPDAAGLSINSMKYSEWRQHSPCLISWCGSTCHSLIRWAPSIRLLTFLM